MKYIAKDLNDVAELIAKMAEGEDRIATVLGKHNKTAKAIAEARAAALREAEETVRSTELRPETA
jgi:hypothetical protein